MRPINHPLVHTADESLLPTSPNSNNGACAQRQRDHHHHVLQPAAGNGDKGTPGEGPDAMYAQNGEAPDDGHALGQPPELSCQVKRRRSEDGERTKRARAAAERGCESDGGLPSDDQPPPAHHHHHHHHKKAARAPASDEGPPKGDLHGVCTLEEGSLKLKISLHRPHSAVTPDGDGLSAGKPLGDGDKTASRPQSPLSLAKPEAQAAGESQHAAKAPDTHCVVAGQPNSASPAASHHAVQEMELVPQSADRGDDKTSDTVLLTQSVPAPIVVRKVEVPTSHRAALGLSTKDTLCTALLNTSSPLQNNAVKSDTQDVGSPQPKGNNNATDTAPSSLAETSIPKIPPYEPHYDSVHSSSSDTPAMFAHPKELALKMDTGTNDHSSSSGARPRKSTTPGHYVPYEAQQNRRRLIQDTSKLRRKGRGHVDLPATSESTKSPHSFHHVHMSVGQNGGRGFVNHNSIMDHPSVHARMFPPESTPTKLAALLNSSRPLATSAGKHRAGGQSKAGTSSGEHQPLDLSRAMPKRSGAAPKLSCLDQIPGNYVPPIAVFYMRPGSRQRLDGIIRKLWAKHNSLLRGRPRP